MNSLTPVTEAVQVVAICDHLGKLKYSSYRPHAFTEYGALMVANILNSAKAVNISLEIVRVFIRLRESMLERSSLAGQL